MSDFTSTDDSVVPFETFATLRAERERTLEKAAQEAFAKDAENTLNVILSELTKLDRKTNLRDIATDILVLSGGLRIKARLGQQKIDTRKFQEISGSLSIAEDLGKLIRVSARDKDASLADFKTSITSAKNAIQQAAVALYDELSKKIHSA